MTTGGIKPHSIVAATRLSIGTFGSTRAVRVQVSTLRTCVNLLVSTVLSRVYWECRVLFVEP